MSKPQVIHLDAYYKLFLYEDPDVAFEHARLVQDGSTTSLLAEWTEEYERWEMRLVSTDGVEYRGYMRCNDYDEPTDTYARLWKLEDGWLWVGHYVADEDEEEPIWIHAVLPEEDEE